MSPPPSTPSHAVPQRHASTPPTHTLSRMRSHLPKPLLTSTLLRLRPPTFRISSSQPSSVHSPPTIGCRDCNHKQSRMRGPTTGHCAAFFFFVSQFQKKQRKKKAKANPGLSRPSFIFTLSNSPSGHPWCSTRQVSAPLRHHRPQATHS